MTVISFYDYYFAKCKAKAKANNLLKSMLHEMEHDGQTPKDGQAKLMEMQLVDLFYQQEKTRIGEVMISETDIYRAAKLIIEQYGDTALIEAAMRQDKLLSQGDYDGAKAWSKIGNAIEWMQMPNGLAEETSH
jgi:hypothetical protein